MINLLCRRFLPNFAKEIKVNNRIKICKHCEYPLKDFKGKIVFVSDTRENKSTDYQYVRTVSGMEVNGLKFKGVVGINVEYEDGSIYHNDGSEDPS